MIPNKIRVVAEGDFTPGNAFKLTFKMREKNNFNYVGFLDEVGCAEIDGAELLASFEQDRNLFLMDYGEPNADFTGEVTARTLAAAEIEGAINVYEKFKRRTKYPSQYGEKLKRAINLPSPKACLIRVEQS